MTTEALTRIDRSEFAGYRDTIAALDARVRAAEGHEALGDAVWRDLEHAGADSAGFLVDDCAYVHVARGDRADDDSWWAALVAPPGPADPALVGPLLDAAVAHAAACGARRVTSWVFGADGSDDDVYRSSGFGADRSLHEMRVPLPLATEARLPEGITVRTFEPGRDDETWLRVNNAAFGDHAEQGGWTVETLRAHTADAWFDPTLFLLAFDAEGLAGFNWLKWHAPIGGDTARGEIYVIGVDPRTQGTGLGRALAIEGLQLVHTRGAPVGMLFVAADNAPRDRALLLARLHRAPHRPRLRARPRPMTTRYAASPAEIGDLLASWGEPRYRVAQLFDGLWAQRLPLDDITTLPKGLRARLAEALPLRARPRRRADQRRRADHQVAVARARRRADRDRADAQPRPGDRLRLVASGLRDGLHLLRDGSGGLRTSPRCRRDRGTSGARPARDRHARVERRVHGHG